MIEITVLDYLNDFLSVPVRMEELDDCGSDFVLLKKSDSTTEKKLIYERKDLLWEVRITMPNFEGDDDEQRDT